jgi:hypothetical protein
MKHPRPQSRRQLALPLDCLPKVRPIEEAREQVIRALADLLLEAMGAVPCELTEGGHGLNESED